MPLLAELLNLPLPDHYQPLLSPPEQRRRRLISVLVQWTSALACLQPMVLVLKIFSGRILRPSNSIRCWWSNARRCR